jgi:hypothetical protein
VKLRPKRKKGTVAWRSLHNEELHKLYASQNTIRVIKLRRMRKADHLSRVGEMRNAYNILVGKPREETAWKMWK